MNAIITGSSKGIGKSIACKFAQSGYNVFLCSRNQQELEETAREMRESFKEIEVFTRPADLSNKAEAIAFGAWCLQQGVPDVLINNAGTYLPGNTIDEPEGNLEMLIQSNLYSAYHVTRALIPAMIKKSAGHIFNICSVASLRAYPGGGSYSISKFALNGFSQNLRHELMKHKIKVTTVFPGAVLTNSWKGFDNSDARIMEASDIADMIFASSQLTPQANVEEILIRPVLGDL